MLLLFAALNLWRALQASHPAFRRVHGLLALALLAGAYFAEAFAVRLVPAFVHLSLAALFAHTLLHPPSLCERLVRLQFPEFKPGIAEYLRQLTGIWTAFFALNVVVCSLLPVFADERIWELYTGVVVYLLMALLAIGEFLYRPRRFPGLGIPPLLETLKVMVRQGHQVFKGFDG